MATLEENLSVWQQEYDWSQKGEEWSSYWGSSESQWRWSLFPRIKSFVPVPTILEIAPGFGRWTHYLKDLCQKLIVVDLSAKCIQSCQQRFSGCSHITYYANDGKSLDMVPDKSIDFAFSMDSLVHAEADVIEAYLCQLAHKLRPDGVGFFHHSNLGAYHRYYSVTTKIPRMSWSKYLLIKMGVLDADHWRALSMSARVLEDIANGAGLRCLRQEIFNWGHSRRLIDCCSIFAREGSCWGGQNVVLKNSRFMQEAKYISTLEKLYSFSK